MSKLANRTRKIVGCAAVAAALGFGAAQALAAPAEAREAAACNPATCRKDCIALGNTGGVCVQDQCACYIQRDPR